MVIMTWKSKHYANHFQFSSWSPTKHHYQSACYITSTKRLHNAECEAPAATSEVWLACLSLYGLYLTVDWFQGRPINHSALGVPLISMFWIKFWRRDAIKHSHMSLWVPVSISPVEGWGTIILKGSKYHYQSQYHTKEQTSHWAQSFQKQLSEL